MSFRKGDFWTDERFALVENILPGRPGTSGKRAKDNRMFLEAVFYVAREGIPWTQLPKRFGNWQSSHTRYIRWRTKGVWPGVFTALRRAGEAEYRWKNDRIEQRMKV
jgi:transposase